MTPQPDAIVEYASFTGSIKQTVKVSRRDKTAQSPPFCFRDDFWYLWDLLRPHERDGWGNIVFSDVPPWLREDAKLYVAHLWLRVQPTIIQIHKNMVAIRHLGKLLPDFNGRVIDLRARHAREFSRRYGELDLAPVTNQGTRRFLNRFVTFIRQLHPDVNNSDFRVEFPKSQTFVTQHQPLERGEAAHIATDVLTQIIDACITDTQTYLDAREGYVDSIDDYTEYYRQHYQKKKQGLFPKAQPTPAMKYLLTRAVKAQAVILAICVGRRAAAICNTRFDVKTFKHSWVGESGQAEHGVMVRFREMKIRNVDEDVPCPDVFGDLALQAIKTARELTADLRRDNPGWEDYLFLVPAHKRKKACVLTPQQINIYLNGVSGSSGLRQRYDIVGGTLTTHNFRVTRATNAWLGGLQVHEVSYDLGHLGTEMAVRHYIVGKEESRRRFQYLMDHGALAGALEDMVSEDVEAHARLDRRHLKVMLEQGRYITPTRYGGCDLAPSSGECPIGYACYTGPGDEGDGCIHHVLTPDALPALEADRLEIEKQISELKDDPAYRVLVENQTNQLRIVEHVVGRVETLRKRLVECHEMSPCGCLNRNGDAPYAES